MLPTAHDRLQRAGSVPEARAGAGQPVDALQASAKPFDLEFVSITRREHIELRLRASQYRSMHARAVERMKATLNN